MDRRLDEIRGDGRALLVIAAPGEACVIFEAFGVDGSRSERFWRRHTLRDGLDCVVTGVGKANAAGGLLRVLDPELDSVVVSCGIGGALPGSECEIGDGVVSTLSVYSDEGIETEEGFETCASMGFGFRHDTNHDSLMGVKPDAEVIRVLRQLGDHEGTVATVSTCAGVDRIASSVVERTGAIVEAMEGAAVGVSVRNAAQAYELARGFLFGEYRVVSNTTGNRSWQSWDLEGSLRVLGDRVACM